MFLSFLFLFCQILLGFLLINFFDKQRLFTRLERIAFSIVIGGLFGSIFVLLLAVLLKSLLLSVYIFIFLVLLLSLFWLSVSFKKISFDWRLANIFSSKNTWALILLFILAMYCLLICGILFADSNGSLKTVLVGWGDTTLHLDIIQNVANSQPFLISHPIMAGANLTYPFLMDFISGTLLKLSGNMVFSFRIPLLIYGLASLILIFCIAYRILKSKSFAVLALFLVISGSGLGFFVFFKDARALFLQDMPGVISFFQNPPHEYTHLDNRTGGKLDYKNTNDNIVWMVPAISFLSHQRSFPMGLAVFCCVLLGIAVYGNRSYFWRFGIIAGTLPIVHSHSFLALFFLMAVLIWFCFKNIKQWVSFGVVTSIIALPQIFYLRPNGSVLDSMRLWFGWMTCEHTTSWFLCSPMVGTDSNVLSFWVKNFGIIFLLWILAIVLSLLIIKNKKIDGLELREPFVVASIVMFLIPNLMLLQPWPFDNNKVIFYWWILAILFCVVPFLMWLWQKGKIGRVLVIILCIFASLAGTIDITSRLLTPDSFYFGYSDGDKNNLRLAEWIKSNTKANEVFLTSQSVDPIPLFLAGRPLYLGYEGWLWSEGLNYSKNKLAENLILQGDMNLACKEKISYILLDVSLRSSFPNMNEDSLLSQGKIVFSQDSPYGKTYILKPQCN